MKKLFTLMMLFVAGCLCANAQYSEFKDVQFKFKKHAAYDSDCLSERRREQIYNNTTYFPHMGTPKALVILVDFQDVHFTIDNPKEAFNKYLNGGYLSVAADGPIGRNYGSVAQYFDDCSFGLFRPQFTLAGPVRLSQNLAVYGANERMDLLIPEACRLVDDEVNFADFDSNADGYVDLVYIIYAGYSESIDGNSTDCIWPKSGTTSGGEYDGKKVLRYGVNGELNGTPADAQKYGLLANGIGLFCHEFSHCLGFADLYGYETTDPSKYSEMNNQGMEFWDLMDSGCYLNNGYTPIEYSAWEREAMGWIRVDTLDAPADIVLGTVQKTKKAYRVLNSNDVTNQEYFMLENIQKEGWNQYLNGHGMLVTHVDFAPNRFEVGSLPNSTKGHPRMTVVAADGLLLSSYLIGHYYNGALITHSTIRTDEAGDPFPGTAENTELTDESVVTYPLYSGTSMNKPITMISEGTDGVISFKFMGGSNTAVNNPSVGSDSFVKQPYYTLDGRKMGTDSSVLPKGIYIVGKKKAVVH